MNDLRKAAEMALKQLQRDDVYLGHRSKTRADAITALSQALTPEVTPEVDKAYTKLDTSDRVLHKTNVPQP